MKDQSKRLKKLLDKDYRDGYLESTVRAGVAYQIQALRKKLGLSQAEFAEKLGKPQSTISRLERTEYGKVSVQTLLDVAMSLDVALLVKFCDYPELLSFAAAQSVAELQPDNIFETVEKGQNSNITAWLSALLARRSSQTEEVRSSPLVQTLNREAFRQSTQGFDQVNRIFGGFKHAA